jgi:eukaryotic-like serine/threonine-protein kinase
VARDPRDAGTEREAVTEVRRPPPPPSRPPPWWRERWWIWGIVLLLFVGALIAFFALGETAEETAADRATVPNVVGLSEDEAVRRVEDQGLEADVEQAASDRPEGTVIDQNPGAGTQLETGDRVVVVVATPRTAVTETETETVTRTETVAPETVEVPDVLDEDQVTAGAEVDDAGLVANTYPVPSSEVQGTVVAENPDPGSELPKGSAVRLNVALGSGPRGTSTVPGLTGMDSAKARDRCRRARFTCRTIERGAASEDDVGKVLDQQPGADTRIAQLSQITLIVGR